MSVLHCSNYFILLDSTVASELAKHSAAENSTSFLKWFKRLSQPGTNTNTTRSADPAPAPSVVPGHAQAWYLQNGSVRPRPQPGNRTWKLFPEESPGDDRIVGTMMHSHYCISGHIKL